MASNTSRSTDLVLQASTTPAQPLARGESTHVAARAGEHYRVQSTSGDGAVRLEDDVLAIRRGDDLALRYGDGTEVVLDRFFVECAQSQCAVELSAGEAAPQWINGDTVAGATNGNGEALLYAHGDQGTIGTLMQAEGFVASGGSGIGELAGMELAQGQATYLPAGHGEGAAAMGTPAMIGLGALALGGLALAAGGGGSSSGSAPSGSDKPNGGLDGGNNNPDPQGGTETPLPPAPTTIEGTVVAGPVIAGHGLEVQVYSAAGQLLKSGAVSADGTYSVEIDGSYNGPVLVRVQDTTPGADYRDEASNSDRDLGIDLRAFSVVPGQSSLVHVNVNMLTELAVRSLGLDGGDAGVSVVSLGALDAAAIVAANQGVAQAFGLTGDLVSGAAPIAVITTTGAPDAAANDYGRILAALSGAEDNNDTNGVLATLQAGLDHNVLSSAAIAAIIAGAAAAAAAAGTPALGLVSSVATLLNGGTGSGNGGAGSLSVDPIAGDNIITKLEAEDGLVVSGHGAAGSMVTVRWGDASREIQVGDDGNWSVSLEGMTLPADGASTLRITQGDQVLVRAVFLATTPPATGGAIEGFIGSDDVQHDIGDYVGNTSETVPALLVGTGLPGTPALYINGDKVAATYDPVKGTLTPVEPLGEGEKTFTWTLSDALGNESAPSEGRTLNVDLTAPPAPHAPVGYVDNAGPIKSEASTAASTDDVRPVLLTGALEVEPGASVRLYVNGDLIDAVYDPVHGTLTLSKDLPAGPNEITMRVVDAVGNESDPSPAMSLTVVTTAPGTPPAPTGYVNSDLPTGSPLSTTSKTTDTTPGVYVGVNLADKPHLYVGEEEVDATYDPVTGTLTPIDALTLGAHALSFTLANAYGESARSGIFTIEVGTGPTAPAAIVGYVDDVARHQSTLADPSTGALTNDARPAFVVGTGETTKLALFVDNIAVAAEYNPTDGTLTPDVAIADGTHSIQWARVNEFGTGAPSVAFSVQIDTEAPVATAAISDHLVPTGSGLENAAASLGSGAMEESAPTFILMDWNTMEPRDFTVHLYIDGERVDSTTRTAINVPGHDSKDGILTVTPTEALSPGHHTVSWAMKDAAGNLGAVGPTTGFAVALPAPVIFDDVPYFTGPLTNSGAEVLTNDNLPSITVGTGITGEFRLYDGETEILSSYDRASGMLTPRDALGDGSHSLHYSLEGGGQTLVSSTVTVTVDTVAPAAAAPITWFYDNSGQYLQSSGDVAKTADARPGFQVDKNSFEDAANPQVALYVDGTLVPATLGAYSSRTILTPDADLALGTHQITWANIDAAGNVGLQSEAYAVEIALGAPRYIDDVPFYVSGPEGQLTRDTNDARPEFLVGADRDVAPVLYDGENIVETTYDRAAGTLALAQDLTEGPHQFSYQVRIDGVDHRSSALALTVDLTPPAASSLPIAIGYTDNTGPVKSASGSYVTGAVTDDPSPDWFYFSGSFNAVFTGGMKHGILINGELYDNQSYQAGSGKFALPANGALKVGENSIQLIAIDAAGNASEPGPAFTLTYEPYVEPSGFNMAPQLMSLPASDAIDLAALTGSVDVAGSGAPAVPVLASGLDTALSQQIWQGVIQSLEQNTGGA